jgi:hypothetical protein
MPRVRCSKLRWSLAALLAALLATASAPVHAEHVLQAGLGLTSTSVREDLLAPLAFTGPKLDLSARYAVLARPHRIESELLLGIGMLENRFDHGAAQLSHGLALSYLHELSEDPARRFALGGIVRWHDELSYLYSWDDAHAWWLSTLTLGVLARHELQLGGAVALESRGELALLGLMGRPTTRYRLNKQDALEDVGYHLDRLGAGTQVVAAWDLQALRLETIARFRGAHELTGEGFGVGLQAAVARTGEPAPYAVLSVGLLLAYGGAL